MEMVFPPVPPPKAIDEAVLVPSMVKVVAAPAKLTVVAVVFNKSKLVDGVVKLVVIAGEVPNTATPVPPVSSEIMEARLAEVMEVIPA